MCKKAGKKPGVQLTLTEAQRGEIRQAFDLFDSEGQGELQAPPRSAAPGGDCVPSLAR
jgi:hypothetical protein